MLFQDGLLPDTQNDLIRELNGFPDFRKMSKPMRSEIIRRAGGQGLKGVLNAIETIFDLGCPGENPKDKPELFGVYPDDYRLIGGLYDKIDSELR